jgi:DNA alkylation damage repair protein AlkB
MYTEISGVSAFKQAEKQYKAAESVQDAKSLGAWDFGLDSESIDVDVAPGSADAVSVCDVEALGRKCKAYSLAGYEGAFIIPGVLSRAQQVELAYLSLSESLAPPNRTNLHCHYTSDQIDSKLRNIWREDGPELDDVHVPAPVPPVEASAASWAQAQTVFATPGSSPAPARIPAHLTLSKLRWATLGYQYDWTARSYEHSAFVPFPAQLGRLSAHLACACGVGYTMTPEAGIVNFYPQGQTMGGHVDDGEEATECPVVSLSLGPPCVFLLGGRTKEETPAAVLLRSGDVLVLGGAARLKFHGVPKVFVSSGAPPNLHPSTAGRDAIHRAGCPHFLSCLPSSLPATVSATAAAFPAGADVAPSEDKSASCQGAGAESASSSCSCGLVPEEEVRRALTVLCCARINVNLRQVYR